MTPRRALPLLALLPGPARAQAAFPDRPIRVIVPFAALVFCGPRRKGGQLSSADSRAGPAVLETTNPMHAAGLVP
jgi:hypothetical protein